MEGLDSLKGVCFRNNRGGVVSLPTHGYDCFLLCLGKVSADVIRGVKDRPAKPFAEHSPVLITSSIYFTMGPFNGVKDTIQHEITPSPGPKPCLDYTTPGSKREGGRHSPPPTPRAVTGAGSNSKNDSRERRTAMRSPNKRLTPFGKLVVKALTDQDMTKADLAEQVGTSPQYLSYILTGTRSGEKYIPAIVAALSLDPRKVEKAIAA